MIKAPWPIIFLEDQSLKSLQNLEHQQIFTHLFFGPLSTFHENIIKNSS